MNHSSSQYMPHRATLLLVLLAFALGNSPALWGTASSGEAPLGTAPLGTVFEIPWSTIDGGGISFAAGENKTLGTTVGQADAGKVSGGAFVLQGGFWVAEPRGASIFSDGFESGDFRAWDRALGNP